MEIVYLIAGGLVLLGLLLFFIFSLRRSYRDPSAAQQYHKIAEKLTLREEEPEEVQEEYDDESVGAFSIANLIGGFLAIFVGVSLFSPIKATIEGTIATSNSSAIFQTSSQASTVLGLVPIFFIVCVVGMGLVVVYRTLKAGGLV